MERHIHTCGAKFDTISSRLKVPNAVHDTPPIIAAEEPVPVFSPKQECATKALLISAFPTIFDSGEESDDSEDESEKHDPSLEEMIEDIRKTFEGNIKMLKRCRNESTKAVQEATAELEHKLDKQEQNASGR